MRQTWIQGWGQSNDPQHVLVYNVGYTGFSFVFLRFIHHRNFKSHFSMIPINKPNWCIQLLAAKSEVT